MVDIVIKEMKFLGIMEDRMPFEVYQVHYQIGTRPIKNSLFARTDVGGENPTWWEAHPGARTERFTRMNKAQFERARVFALPRTEEKKDGQPD